MERCNFLQFQSSIFQQEFLVVDQGSTCELTKKQPTFIFTPLQVTKIQQNMEIKRLVIRQ